MPKRTPRLRLATLHGEPTFTDDDEAWLKLERAYHRSIPADLGQPRLEATGAFTTFEPGERLAQPVRIGVSAYWHDPSVKSDNFPRP
jgi:hypothetical protein